MKVRIKRSKYFALFVVVITTMTYGLDGRADEGKVGEIRYSMLSESQFQTEYGPDWILMDGRDIMSTDLYPLLGKQFLPDARGVYLRGKNYDRDKKTGQPEGDREIGSYLDCTIESHTHQDTGHSHGFDLGVATTHGAGGAGVSRGSGHSWLREGVSGTISIGHANIQATGSSETRPRSIVVNTFIKVDDSSRRTRFAKQDVGVKSRSLESDPKFVEAVQNIVVRMMNQ